MKHTVSDEKLWTLITARFEQSMNTSEAFFEASSEKIARACWTMARHFHQGGRLLAFGNGPCATDAQHVAVEFVHPVIVGKRALPALALPNDSVTLSGFMRNGNAPIPFAHQLQVLGRPQDIALGFSLDGNCRNVVVALEQARHMKMLTLGLTGGDGGLLARMPLDFCFIVPSQDPMGIQEIHETLYHVLWELVHVFFEHEGLLS